MAKIKLTKNEQKKQKDSLKRFSRYLPTLQLKKQQLQIEARKIDEALRERRQEQQRRREEINAWAAVLAEGAGLEKLVLPPRVVTGESNIAGVDIPVFKDAMFAPAVYDLFVSPIWVDAAVAAVQGLLRLQAETAVLQKQYDLLREELTITTQRVNLFEKIKIPETRENIRSIQIYLGDQQTAAVVRGKISKSKLMEKAAG
jgi:V/A-type H+-transporting ATPase subunit D